MAVGGRRGDGEPTVVFNTNEQRFYQHPHHNYPHHLHHNHHKHHHHRRHLPHPHLHLTGQRRLVEFPELGKCRLSMDRRTVTSIERGLIQIFIQPQQPQPKHNHTDEPQPQNHNKA